jgi:hypothetical protein
MVKDIKGDGSIIYTKEKEFSLIIKVVMKDIVKKG